MKNSKLAFTLIEVLISITLLSLVLMALYKSADILRNSNLHLFHYLEKSSHTLKGSQTLYLDLMHSDYNVTINNKDKFHQLIINRTRHSIHGLSQAKVVWLIYKDDNTLLRLEGGEYHLPLKSEERVEVDVIAKNLELFKVYKSKKKSKLLVLIKIKGQEPQVFMTQNLPEKPKLEKDKNGSAGSKLENPKRI